MIALQGRIQTGSYTDDRGIKRYTFEVVAGEASFCGEKRGDNPSTASVTPSLSGTEKADEGTGYYSTAAPGDFDEITDDEDLPY